MVTVAWQWLSTSIIYLAKELEFRAVVVMAKTISLQTGIETVTDDSDLEEVYNTVRICSTSPAPARETICS